MNNTFGKNVTVTLFGESHGKAIGAVLDGIAPGIPVDETDIAHALSLRRGRLRAAKRTRLSLSAVSTAEKPPALP